MADTVQYQLERMLPELEDLESRKLFSRSEIKEIVRKRRDFEYMLKRPSTLKRDYLRYVQYETELENVRRARKKVISHNLLSKGEKWRGSLCDRASAMRIMFIYERAVTRFKGDLDLWFRFLEYCRAQGSRRFQKAATKALRLHPTVPGLWIYAAAWEFEHNLNVTAARVLMQRGLRMCPKSENLWVEYFRMELTAAQKLKARQIVLGIGHKPRPEALLENGNATEHSGMVEVELDGNESRDLEIVARKEDAGINLMVEQEASFKIARAIYRSAIAALPNSPGLRQQFLEVIEAIDLEQAGALEIEIHSGLRDNFPGDEKSWDWQARRCLLKVHKQGVDNIKSAHEKAIQVYEEAIQSVPSARMYELYAHFLAEWLETDHMEGVSKLGVSETEQENKEEEASEALLDLYSRAESAGVASDVLAQGHVNLLIRLGKEEEARELARKNCMEGASLCGSANAWALYMLLERSFLTVDSDGMIQMAKLFRQALKIPIADAKPLWQMAFEVLGGQESHFDSLLQMLETALGGGGGNHAGAEVACTFVKWVLHAKGIEQARQVYTRFVALPGPSMELFRQCISIEAQLHAIGNTEALKYMRKLFNSAVEIYGQTDEELWLEYCFQERKAGNIEAATAVYWKAQKTLRDPSSFYERYQALS
ncbi:hypothetical protein CY35_18G045200 [Sphagnum magellanicum]|nr:hypothetical protein CY35_18G045200 [Sphagnum magellanicum]